MSALTACLFFLLVVGYVFFQIVKNMQINSLSSSLKKKDYETVVKIADMPMARRFVGKFSCDLYKLRAFYLSKNVEKFDNMLSYMIDTEYKNEQDKKSFLEEYFHVFLVKENKKYSKQILDAMRKLEDDKLLTYCEQSYQVMIEKKTDLIEVMDEEIEGKYYYGSRLGIILFMIAKQYEYLDNKEKALLYYHSASLVFYKKDFYMPLVKKEMEKLQNEGIELKENNK